MKKIRGACVFSERRDVALELLGAARTLPVDGPLVTLAVGPDAADIAREQLLHGADHAYTAVAGDLEALRRVLALRQVGLVLIGATAHGTGVAARLAQGLAVGCAGDCTRLSLEDGRLVIERTCLGRFVERQVIETRPAIVTVRPRRFEPPGRENDADGTVEALEIEPMAAATPVVEIHERGASAVRIDRAEVVVGIGRGLKNAADLQMIERLASTLGGVVGASRPLTDDLQWLESGCKIGLSGVTVKPKLYIACGISGQIEHTVGMRESGVVVAINKDPGAPIMQQADYCIVGDLYEVVPALIEAIEEARSQGTQDPDPREAQARVEDGRGMPSLPIPYEPS